MGLKDDEGSSVYYIEHNEVIEPYGDKLQEIKRRIERADLLIGFNIKFDLHWIQRYVPDIKFPPIFDTQLAEFVLADQSTPLPALDDVAHGYGLGRKYDVVKLEYWDRGIDTCDIPPSVLTKYTASDVALTEGVFLAQREKLQGSPKRRLLVLQFEDTLILQEMERNGLFYRLSEADRRGAEVLARIAAIDVELNDLVGHNCINWSSDDHLSCVLFGGLIYERYRHHYTRTLKDGTVKQKERWEEKPIEFPRLVKPLQRSEIKPTKGLLDHDLERVNVKRIMDGKRPYQRIYSVGEPVLKRLKPKGKKARRIIELILERSDCDKLYGTYYAGMIKFCEKMEWGDQIHGSFSQATARTSRLASSKPNLQNFDARTKELFYSRYV